jgi:hypothetical protein
LNRLVAFVGFKSSGKNTAANVLIDHGYLPMSFADAMKDALAAIFCWDRYLLEGVTDESRQWRETVDHWWAERLGIADFSPRWAMRHFGTDIMRRHFNQELWVLNVTRRIMLAGDHPVVLIDARFPNEIALARRLNGAVARIKRGPDPKWFHDGLAAAKGDAEAIVRMTEQHAIHQSEWAWLAEPVDAILMNDWTIADLHTQVINWLDG